MRRFPASHGFVAPQRSQRRFSALRRLMAYVAAGAQDMLEYRADYLIRTVLNLVALLVDTLVWVAVFRSHSGVRIGMYDLPHLLSYIVAAQMTLQLVDGEIQWVYALDSLFHFALKPDGIYGRVLRFFLTIILPMTVIASFP